MAFLSSTTRSSLHPSFSSLSMKAPSTKEDTPVVTTPVPVTLLAGFLGSGKTSCLTNLLSNNEGYKIGVVINDIASVNIDAKLVANRMDPNGIPSASSPAALLKEGETIELQNGCACCSLADELLDSMDQLLDGGKRKFDAVVVELSGVGDPTAVKQNWMDAASMGHPSTLLADVNRVVTVIDAATFGTDWMTWDTAGDRGGWVEEDDDCATQRKVPELLAEQVEAADTLLINKVDLAGASQVSIASGLARQLNKDAELFETSFGQIPIDTILGLATTQKKEKEKEKEKCIDPGCADPGCTKEHDDSHSHDHASADHEASSSSCSDPGCTDTSHDHTSAEHEVSSSSCSDPGCSDTSHSHDHKEEESCADPGCTDTSHSHDHASSSTATANLGISSFVYKRSVPFNSPKLMTLLNRWPVPIKAELDLDLIQEAQRDGYEENGKAMAASPFVGVLRSKGFCWMAPTQWSGRSEDSWRHDTAMYWSHAGKHFGITTAGKWWGSISKDQMKDIFSTNLKEYERILAEDWMSDEFGDRRQELVFIGTNLDQEEIERELDSCLMEDGGDMENYKVQLKKSIDTTIIQ